jgi:hypothetical protein
MLRRRLRFLHASIAVETPFVLDAAPVFQIAPHCSCAIEYEVAPLALSHEFEPSPGCYSAQEEQKMMWNALTGSRLSVLLPILLVASGADAATQTYTVTGHFNMIAGATGNIAGFPTDSRLLASMTPVGEFTAAIASGSMTIDPSSGEFLGISVAIDDASFTLDATWHIAGLPPPPHGTISNSNMSHGATGGEVGAVGPGEIDYATGVDFQVVSGTASCSSPFGALFCQNDSIGPFFDVNTGEIYAVGQSNPFAIDILPDQSVVLTIVFDTGIVTGDAQAVQTITLTGSPASAPTVPALPAWGIALLVVAIVSRGMKKLG